MSKQTITNTDSGSVSLGKINNNFDELYDEKITATQTVALTNKTIDADLNTISDLTPANAKTGNKTGLDTSFVTGTKGDNGELAKWNSDGDLVSTDVTIATTVTSASTDLTIPTSKAVFEAMQTVSPEEKSVFVTYGNTTGTVTTIGSYPCISINSSQVVGYRFSVPADFTEFVSLKWIMIPDATETIQWDITISRAAADVTYDASTGNDSNETFAVTSGKMTFAHIGSTNALAILNGLSANDIVGIQFTSDTTIIRPIGMIFTYK
jgi:hypothetical protein